MCVLLRAATLLCWPLRHCELEGTGELETGRRKKKEARCIVPSTYVTTRFALHGRLRQVDVVTEAEGGERGPRQIAGAGASEPWENGLLDAYTPGGINIQHWQNWIAFSHTMIKHGVGVNENIHFLFFSLFLALFSVLCSVSCNSNSLHVLVRASVCCSVHGSCCSSCL